jgi:hypothetical protein
MKITEVIIAPKESKDTISSDTISSAIKGDQTQDLAPQNIVSKNDLALEVDNLETHPDHSAITEGVSQILRRIKGKAPKKGFRCSSGPRKGRIVAKPSTCFQKTDPKKSAKIRKKRQAKAGIAGKKLAMTKRSGAGSLRLKGAQIKQAKNKGKSVAKRIGAKAPIKSKIVK